jgi:acyl-CoA synthetase (AMP-forming)/AMP-acid ligase II/acyl carrier protein
LPVSNCMPAARHFCRKNTTTFFFMQSEMNNIAEYLVFHAHRHPEKTAFVFTGDDEQLPVKLPYAGLAAAVKQLAQSLAAKDLYGKRALLIYQDVQSFIVSFLACQYTGIIPVPVPYVQGSRQNARLAAVAADAGVAAILCCGYSVEKIEKGFAGFPETGKVEIIATDTQLPGIDQQETLQPLYHETSFIQYTSGSTGSPKGVVVSSSNLLHNQQLIAQTFRCDENAVILSWLPFHHDMGLIGNILHSVYTGCTCVLMPPSQFIQNPLRWLTAISTYRATHSGGPNFAYDLCVSKIPATALEQLDLSCWQAAYNGSEPLRQNTLHQFSTYFQPAGFGASCIIPCYGLAEATLLVSAGNNTTEPAVLYIDSDAPAAGKIVLTNGSNPAARALVSSGRVAAGMEVKIVVPGSKKPCGELEEGEILVAGDSVTKGYWNKDNNEVFSSIDGRHFLHTGDLGFFMGEELFVHGRIKEMLIVRGKNFYPADIEQAAAESNGCIGGNSVAVFSISDEDRFVIAAEIKREFLKNINAGKIIDDIVRSVTDVFGIQPFDVLLLAPLGIPRTTSGKIQRIKCREMYARKEFTILGSQEALLHAGHKREKNILLLHEVVRNAGYETIRAYITDIIECKTGVSQFNREDDNVILTEMGMDSLGAMEVINTVNKDLAINIDASDVFRENTLPGLIVTVENMLWLKNGAPFKEEITV